VTRARVTQIMNLLLLAPDIQELILFGAQSNRGERSLRAVSAEVSWSDQRKALLHLTSSISFA
jgi:hypothetical protein